MITKNTLIKGAKNGVHTTWQLIKIMLPIYIAVVFLKHSGLLKTMSGWVEPLMKLIGLPGEAAYALILGNVLNLYAAIGAMSAVALTTKEVTIIALILLISHNIFMEAAVTKSCGLKVGPFVAIRITFGLLAGLIANILL